MVKLSEDINETRAGGLGKRCRGAYFCSHVQHVCGRQFDPATPKVTTAQTLAKKVQSGSSHKWEILAVLDVLLLSLIWPCCSCGSCCKPSVFAFMKIILDCTL